MQRGSMGSAGSVRGVTAVELAVVLAIMAILVSLAIPSWKEFSARLRRDSLASQLTAHMALARSAAISRGRPVALSTLGIGWHSGWRVHLELHRNGSWDVDEPILAEHQGDPQAQMVGNGTMSRYVMFDADGRPTQTGGGFLAGSMEVCIPSQQGVTMLVMSAAGRVRQEQRQSGCSR